MQSLIKAGWSPAKPTVWLGEGLLMYLEPTAVARLLRALRNVSPPGSTLLMSLVSQGAVARARQSRSNGAMSQWQWGTDDPRGYFGMLNWRVELVETPEECGPRYGRRMPLRRARAQSLGRQGSARAEVDPGVQTAVPLSPARQEQGALRATFYVRATC